MSELKELKGIVDTWITILSKGEIPDITSEEVELVQKLIKQAEQVPELKRINRELNIEIGQHAMRVWDLSQSIGSNLADLKILSTRMLGGNE